MMVEKVPVSAMDTAAKGTRRSPEARAAVPRPWAAVPMARPRAVGSFTFSASRSAPALAPMRPVMTTRVTAADVSARACPRRPWRAARELPRQRRDRRRRREREGAGEERRAEEAAEGSREGREGAGGKLLLHEPPAREHGHGEGQHRRPQEHEQQAARGRPGAEVGRAEDRREQASAAASDAAEHGGEDGRRRRRRRNRRGCAEEHGAGGDPGRAPVPGRSRP